MRFTEKLISGLVLALCLTLFSGLAQAEEKRLALLMANEDYPTELGRLSNTHEDAATIEASLKTLGFEITKVRDADSTQMKGALSNFARTIEEEASDGDDVVVFVYASMHGATANVGGIDRNFLIPSHETIQAPYDLVDKGIRIDQVVEGLSTSSAKAVIFVSDACRNELEQSFSKSTTKGFVPITVSGGIVIAYATAEGSTTPDDGLFSKVLAEEIQKEGRKASFSMLAALEEVAKQRTIEGQPYMSSGGLPDWFCFNECPSDQLLTENEAIALGQALSSNSLAKLQEFQTRFPHSNFLDLIETRMSNVGVRDLRLTIKRIECLLADDEGPFNAVDMRRMSVKARPLDPRDGDELMVLYDWDGPSKEFSTGDTLQINKSATFRFDPRSDGSIKLSALLVDNDPIGQDETGRFDDRDFPIDRIGQEQSFNISSRDFSFNIVYQFDEL